MVLRIRKQFFHHQFFVVALYRKYNSPLSIRWAFWKKNERRQPNDKTWWLQRNTKKNTTNIKLLSRKRRRLRMLVLKNLISWCRYWKSWTISWIAFELNSNRLLNYVSCAVFFSSVVFVVCCCCCSCCCFSTPFARGPNFFEKENDDRA